MSIIPSPDEAAKLRTAYAGNLIISVAVNAVQAFGDVTADEAANLLSRWRYNPELSRRERRAVLAFFVGGDDPGWTSGTCGGAS